MAVSCDPVAPAGAAVGADDDGGIDAGVDAGFDAVVDEVVDAAVDAGAAALCVVGGASSRCRLSVASELTMRRAKN